MLPPIDRDYDAAWAQKEKEHDEWWERFKREHEAQKARPSTLTRPPSGRTVSPETSTNTILAGERPPTLTHPGTSTNTILPRKRSPTLTHPSLPDDFVPASSLSTLSNASREERGGEKKRKRKRDRIKAFFGRIGQKFSRKKKEDKQRVKKKEKVFEVADSLNTNYDDPEWDAWKDAQTDDESDAEVGAHRRREEWDGAGGVVIGGSEGARTTDWVASRRNLLEGMGLLAPDVAARLRKAREARKADVMKQYHATPDEARRIIELEDKVGLGANHPDRLAAQAAMEDFQQRPPDAWTLAMEHKKAERRKRAAARRAVRAGFADAAAWDAHVAGLARGAQQPPRSESFRFGGRKRRKTRRKGGKKRRTRRRKRGRRRRTRRQR